MKRVLILAGAALAGIALSGAVMAVIVPSDPGRFGPRFAVAVTIACVTVLVGAAAIITRGGAGPQEPH